LIPVRCACGKRYNAKAAHAGKSIKCSCGRTVPIPLGTTTARLRSLLSVLTWGWLGAVVAAALLLWVLGDRWWPATLLLYAPRWPLLLPGLLLVPAALLLRRRLLLPQGLAVAVTVVPVMGFTLGWRGVVGAGTGELRVVTFNVAGLTGTTAGMLAASLTTYEPDVIAFQECPERLAEPVHWGAGWHTGFEKTICIASRYPIVSVKSEERVRTGAQGGTGTVVLFRLARPADSVDLAVVHLETPRKGLEPLRAGGRTGAMRLNTLVRDAGSSRASRWIRGQADAPIIAGDFNLTVESAIYRTHWARCANAFTQTGRGFGYTRVLRQFSARIDHVLACGDWRPVRARVGPFLGSDHRPLIVDLKRR
jgi:endonuclease/exonuclease/phosphatase (EEP) superfamily protein YafD